MAAEDRSTAAASGATGVDILLFEVIYHKAAILVYFFYFSSVILENIIQQLTAHKA